MLQKYFMKNNFTFQPRESLSFCILKDLFLFLSVCVCVCVCVCTHVCALECRCPWNREVSTSLQLELQTAVSYLM